MQCTQCGGSGFYYLLPSGMNAFEMKIETIEKTARRIYCACQDDCPGHVASAQDQKICGRCGIHIDSLRPDEDGNI